MRIVWISLLACPAMLAVATAFADSPQPPGPIDAAAGVVLVPRVAPSADSDNEVAGLAKGSKPMLLNWERVYALALARARADRGPQSPTLDPEALAREAAKVGIADFARFKKEFVGEGPFRDPSAKVLSLLREMLAVDSARRNVAAHEALNAVLMERIQGESGGLTRLDLDTVFAALVRTRQRLDHQIREFRDGLDELKVALGLSPRASVILDRKGIAEFQTVFDAIEEWSRSPTRRLAELPRLIAQLPLMGDVDLGGEPILEAIDVNPDRWEEVMTKAARLALENRGDAGQGQARQDAGVALELRVRRRIRRLVELRGAYDRTKQGYEDGAKRNYELAIRRRDQAFERLLAPPSEVEAPRSPLLEGLVAQIADVFKAGDELVGLWTLFRAERLALNRDLGVLPYNDWNSFYADLKALRGAAQVAPAVPGAAQVAPAPAPPAPPQVAPAPPGP